MLSNDLRTVQQSCPLISKIVSVDLHFGIFFDGTKNSMYNRMFKKQHPKYKDTIFYNDFDTSFENGATNIERMLNDYIGGKTSNINESHSVYITGSGTFEVYEDKNKTQNDYLKNNCGTSIKPDSKIGLGLARGETGILSKSEIALKKLEDKFKLALNELEKKHSELKDVNTTVSLSIFVDIFGFSRGATTARYFVNLMNSKGFNKLKKLTQEATVDYQVQVSKVRYLGLFDTVVSYIGAGIPNNINDDDGFLKKLVNNFDYSVGQNATSTLKLNSVSRCDYTVHLCAADEFRYFFSLTNIKSTTVSKNGLEIFVPGCHADVGGGYVDLQKSNRTLRTSIRKKDIEKLKLFLRENGQFSNDASLTMHPHSRILKSEEELVPNKYNSFYLYKLKAEETLSNEYEEVCLNIMVGHLNLKCPGLFEDEYIMNSIVSFEYKEDFEKKRFLDYTRAYLWEKTKINQDDEKFMRSYKYWYDNESKENKHWLAKLRHNFVHWSADEKPENTLRMNDDYLPYRNLIDG